MILGSVKATNFNLSDICKHLRFTSLKKRKHFELLFFRRRIETASEAAAAAAAEMDVSSKL